MWCNGVPRLLKLAYLAAGCSVVFVVWGVSRQATPRAPTLHERWVDVIRDLPPIVPGPRVVKTDRIVPNSYRPDFSWVVGGEIPIPIDKPRIVETQRIVKPPIIEKPKPPIIEKPQKKVTPDICSAHRMRKVYNQNGKTWRCRK